MAHSTAYLIDSSIYVFRAWFTLPDSLRNNNGDPVNAVYGFIDFVAGFLEETKPTHLSFAFDQSLTSSFRNSIYPLYKANRDPAPDELKLQFAYCRRFIEAVGFPILSSDRYEADDLIGTAASHARAQGHNVTILSADKDLAQLIEDKDILWDNARDRKFNPKKVKEHFGVRPDQIADQLALAGDKVDNIPGVPGVGMTTAARLLTKFESIDELLKNIPAISDMKIRGAKRIQGLIEEHQEMILLCKRLTEIKCDVENLHGDYALERGQCDYAELDELFNEIGIGNLRREKWKKLIAQ